MPFDIYAEITDQIITRLEQGMVPWRSPILGKTSAGQPKNLHSTKPYRGVNVFLLACAAWSHGYESSYWLTFKQAKERGGTVRKGQKSSMVVFWKQFETTDKATGKKEKISLLRYYNVFNIEQCDGIQPPDVKPFEPTAFSPIEAAAAVINNFQGGPQVEHGGTRAYYRPATDIVRLPEPSRFSQNEEYYSTAFHELAHATGHSSRLNRKIDTEMRSFGSPDYSKEELIAEMAAAFLCGHTGISPTVIDNQAAYLQGWIKALKGDRKLIIAAGGAAQKAADWILNLRNDDASPRTALGS